VFDTDAAWFDSDVADPGIVPPRTHVAAGFWESLRGPGGGAHPWLAPVLGPIGAQGASRLANACVALDMNAGDAGLLGFAAYGIGRVGEQAAKEAPPAAHRPLSSDLARYLGANGSRLDRLFDLDEGAAR
jgi:hypothetical protein